VVGVSFCKCGAVVQEGRTAVVASRGAEMPLDRIRWRVEVQQARGGVAVALLSRRYTVTGVAARVAYVAQPYKKRYA